MGSFNIVSPISKEDMSSGDMVSFIMLRNNKLFEPTIDSLLIPITTGILTSYEDYGDVVEKEKSDWETIYSQLETYVCDGLPQSDIVGELIACLDDFKQSGESIGQRVSRHLLEKNNLTEQICYWSINKSTYDNLVEIGNLEFLISEDTDIPKYLFKDAEFKQFVKGIALTGNKFLPTSDGTQDNNTDLLYDLYKKINLPD